MMYAKPKLDETFDLLAAAQLRAVMLNYEIAPDAIKGLLENIALAQSAILEK